MLTYLTKIWAGILQLLSRSFAMSSDIQELKQDVLGLANDHAAQNDQLARIEGKLDKIISFVLPGPAVAIKFFVQRDDGSPPTFGEPMTTMTDSQHVTLTAQPVDAKGFPAQVDGGLSWASSDETVVTVTPAADGMSADISAVSPGTAKVTATGDADLGSGVTPIVGSEDFTITAGGATQFKMTVGNVTEQGS